MKRTILLLLFTVLIAVSFAKTIGGLTLDFIQLFERGDTSIDKEDRVYTDEFNISESRYIACELNVINEYYDQYDKQYEIVYKYYYPDGDLFGEIRDDVTFISSWETAWYHHSYGYENPGNWEGGEYTVMVYVDGQYFGEKKFRMYNDEHMLEYTGIDFFEGPYDPPSEEYRDYKTTFPKSSTRYIFYQIYFDNYYYDLEDQLVKFNAKYYYPDGDFMGDVGFDYLIPLDWEDGWVSKGFGWDETGNWDKGRYRVEVYIGKDKVADTYFNIE